MSDQAKTALGWAVITIALVGLILIVVFLWNTPEPPVSEPTPGPTPCACEEVPAELPTTGASE